MEHGLTLIPLIFISLTIQILNLCWLKMFGRLPKVLIVNRVKGGAKLSEGFKGTYEADETKAYITYKQDLFDGTWHDISNREIAEIPFQCSLNGDTLILTNAFGKELRFNRKKE